MLPGLSPFNRTLKSTSDNSKMAALHATIAIIIPAL